MKLEPQYSVSFVAQLTNSNSFSHPLKFFRYWRHQDYSSYNHLWWILMGYWGHLNCSHFAHTFRIATLENSKILKRNALFEVCGLKKKKLDNNAQVFSNVCITIASYLHVLDLFCDSIQTFRVLIQFFNNHHLHFLFYLKHLRATSFIL